MHWHPTGFLVGKQTYCSTRTCQTCKPERGLAQITDEDPVELWLCFEKQLQVNSTTHLAHTGCMHYPQMTDTFLNHLLAAVLLSADFFISSILVHSAESASTSATPLLRSTASAL